MIIVVTSASDNISINYSHMSNNDLRGLNYGNHDDTVDAADSSCNANNDGIRKD